MTTLKPQRETYTLEEVEKRLPYCSVLAAPTFTSRHELE
jgi:hypothetical protein